MKMLEKTARDWVKSVQVEQNPHIAEAAYLAGFKACREMAAIRGRLAQLENKVVDIEIMSLGESEAQDQAADQI